MPELQACLRCRLQAAKTLQARQRNASGRREKKKIHLQTRLCSNSTGSICCETGTWSPTNHTSGVREQEELVVGTLSRSGDELMSYLKICSCFKSLAIHKFVKKFSTEVAELEDTR